MQMQRSEAKNFPFLTAVETSSTALTGHTGLWAVGLHVAVKEDLLVLVMQRSEAKNFPCFSAIETSSIVSTAMTTICIAEAIGATIAASITIAISTLSITVIVEATTGILAGKVFLGNWTRVPITTAAASIPRHFDDRIDR
jgi:hypothetical protein